MTTSETMTAASRWFTRGERRQWLPSSSRCAEPRQLQQNEPLRGPEPAGLRGARGASGKREGGGESTRGIGGTGG